MLHGSAVCRSKCVEQGEEYAVGGINMWLARLNAWTPTVGTFLIESETQGGPRQKHMLIPTG